MKKLTAVVLSLLLVFLSVLQYNVHADRVVHLGEIYYWYSDRNNIGRWLNSNLKLYCSKLNMSNDFDFDSYITNGTSPWSNALSISINGTSFINNGDMRCYGGTMYELMAVDSSFGTLDSSLNGKAVWNWTYEGEWLYVDTNNRVYEKSGYEMTYALIGIIQKYGKTENEYTNTYMHELGHALGYSGHSSYSSDIMYGYGSGVTVLSFRDKRFLSQIYNY